MRIEITLSREEVQEIVKTHALKKFPIGTENREIYVTESYGAYIIVITDIEKEEENNDQSDRTGTT